MELTRRDALAALAASGVTVASGAVLEWGALGGGGRGSSGNAPSEGSDDASIAFTEREKGTLVALARTLYPTAVTGVPAFVERYVVGRVRDRPVYADGVKAALGTLDEYATEWFDEEYRTLSTTDRDTLLRQMGLENTSPDPTGTDPERLRYYLVNELLYALYRSPRGGRLVGIENPRGYPGGLESYQHGSRTDR